MNLTEKLTLIASRCREIIELAERASRGPCKTSNRTAVAMSTGARLIVAECNSDGCTSVAPYSNAAYIAASWTLTPALARGILAVIELWDDGVVTEETVQAIADSFTGEGWEAWVVSWDTTEA